MLEEIKADPKVYYVFREALLSAGLTNGVVNKWMPAKPGMLILIINPLAIVI